MVGVSASFPDTAYRPCGRVGGSVVLVSVHWQGQCPWGMFSGICIDLTHASQALTAFLFPFPTAREENVATFRGSEYLCYDLSQNPIQSSSDEITLSFKTWQRNGLILHTGKSADYVNLALKDGAVSLVINLGSGAFEAIVEPVNGKFNDNAWHDVKVTRNLRQVMAEGRECLEAHSR